MGRVRSYLRALPSGATAILLYLAVFKVLLHVATAGRYGYFRDELYYMAAGERLQFGYVDFPPLVALVARLTRATLGDSLVALHLPSALAGAVTVVLAGLIARELGGGRFAQGMAALATLAAPNFLVMGTWLSMDAFDQLFWVAGAYVLVHVLKRPRARYLWLLFGLVAGLGLLTKVTMLYFGFAVFVAVLLTPARKQLRIRWPWLGGGVAFAFLVPYLLWQVINGWPTLEFWGNYGAKVDPASPVEFLVEQVLTMQPATLPLWVAGLLYLLFARDARPFRALGFVFLILLAVFMAQNAKFYFLAPAYPPLFAAGGVALERLLSGGRLSLMRPAYAVVLAVSAAVVAPLTVLPLLPVDTLAEITGAAGGGSAVQQETRQTAALPQNFADRFGWEEKVATVSRVYERLPAEEKDEACVLAGNYGQAAAVDFYGERLGLPRAISGHNSYYLWGPNGCSGEVVVSIGVPRERLQAVFGEIEESDTAQCENCMPDEDDLPVYVCRDPKMPFREAWPLFKHYD